jgi:pyruvate dehydrogenase E2 component (dihydrolipoamide acetyltransferase)
MATAVIMPRQGQSVESCLIGKWYKSKGDKVSVGDILFTYETDKATFEEESKVDGVMLDIFFEEGDDVECLVNVCVIGAVGENVDEFRPTDSDIGERQGPRQGDGSSVRGHGDGSSVLQKEVTNNAC